MARAAVAALLVSLPLAVSAAAKDPNTIVFATFGDWGWSLTGMYPPLQTHSLGALWVLFRTVPHSLTRSLAHVCLRRCQQHHSDSPPV